MKINVSKINVLTDVVYLKHCTQLFQYDIRVTKRFFQLSIKVIELRLCLLKQQQQQHYRTT